MGAYYAISTVDKVNIHLCNPSIMRLGRGVFGNVSGLCIAMGPFMRPICGVRGLDLSAHRWI